MSGIMQIAHEVPYKMFRDAFDTDQDEMISLFERPDYEEAARTFVRDDADVVQLEEIADTCGYWGDVLDKCLPAISEDEDGCFRLFDSTELFDSEDDARESAIDSAMGLIREAVLELMTAPSEYQDVCDIYGLEPGRNEVYEHWVLSDWLASKLDERGEIVGKFAGLTIWGRCCSGQSISMDQVIQDIAEGSY
jgi:hypothetical protein